MKSNTLRGYQQKMLQSLNQAWKQHQSVMVQMPTGTGKTHLMAAVIQKYADKGVLVVAHRRELIAQISQTLDSFSVEHGLIVSGNETDYSRKVQVASIQTLARKGGITHEISPNPKLIIVDEAHHALANTYRMLWDTWPKARFLGLTATPCRLNGAPFTDLFDTLLQSWSIVDFIKKGWLSDLDYVSVRLGSKTIRRIAWLDKRSVDGDFQTTQMALVLDTPESIGQLYAAYKEYADGKKGIVYAINREHAKHIADYYQEQGVRCAVIDSKTPTKERQQIVEGYRQQALDVMVNVDIFGEGFDCPEVEFIQLARPTLSLSLYMQQVGRGMRISEGKSAVTILDQVGAYLLFGLPTIERDWQGMFLGTASGKGSLQILKKAYLRKNDEDRILADERLFRIDSLAEREKERPTDKPPGKKRVKKDDRDLWGNSFDPKNSYHSIVRRMASLWVNHNRLLAEIPMYLSKAELIMTLVDKDWTWLPQMGLEGRCRMLVIVNRRFQQDMLDEALSKTMKYYEHHIFAGTVNYGLDNSKVVISGDDVLKERFVTLASVFTPNIIVIWDGNMFSSGNLASILSVWAKAKVLGLTATPSDNWSTSRGMLYEGLVAYDEAEVQRSVPKRKGVTLVSSPYEGVTLMYMQNMKPRIDPKNYVTAELRNLLSLQENVKHVYQCYERYAKGRRGIIYAFDAYHANCLQGFFVQNGVLAEVLDVNMEETAKRMMFDFCRGRTTVLIAINDYDVSYPFPEMEFVQMTYPSQQLSIYLSMVESGRKASAGFREPERVQNSDNKLVVIDNTLMSGTFGHPTKKRDWSALFQESLYYDNCGQQRRVQQPKKLPTSGTLLKTTIDNKAPIPTQIDKWERRRKHLLGE